MYPQEDLISAGAPALPEGMRYVVRPSSFGTVYAKIQRKTRLGWRKAHIDATTLVAVDPDKFTSGLEVAVYAAKRVYANWKYATERDRLYGEIWDGKKPGH